jgi:hypothetical protein
MTISQVLEHPWLQKFDAKKLPEKRRLNKLGESNFVIYSTVEEDKRN